MSIMLCFLHGSEPFCKPQRGGKMIDAVFGWLKDNKDGVLALAALLSPATALVAVFVSYRAVIIGPRIQREIAQQQSALNNRQIELQQGSLALATRQLRANVLGSYDQKWIDGFRDALAELMGLVAEKLPISIGQTRTADYKADRLLEIFSRARLLINRIRLSFESSDTRMPAFIIELLDLLNENDLTESANMAEKISATAVAFIEEREKRIASHIGP
jgi:hypothetical protein